MPKNLTLDEKVSIQRAYTTMGHTIGETDPHNTCYLTKPPSYFTHLSYTVVDEMVKELALASCLGELSTVQRYMYWYLKDNGIITSLDALNFKD